MTSIIPVLNQESFLNQIMTARITIRADHSQRFPAMMHDVNVAQELPKCSTQNRSTSGSVHAGRDGTVKKKNSLKRK